MTNTTATHKNKRATAKPISKSVPAVLPTSTNPLRNGKPSEEDIRLRAYQKWEAAGRPGGDGMRFWLQAEQELLQVG